MIQKAGKNMGEMVWYACYGSNLYRKRFMCYIQGGALEGKGSEYSGCRDRTPPVDEGKIIIPHQLFFSQNSSKWEGKGVAFVRPERHKEIRTLGRMYLITREQFVDVALQENGLKPRNYGGFEINIEEAVERGTTTFRQGWYGLVIYLGHEGKFPIFTLSSSWNARKGAINPPGRKYRNIIMKGLKETYNMSNKEIENYLGNQIGIKL